jgi:hypothetical protein
VPAISLRLRYGLLKGNNHAKGPGREQRRRNHPDHDQPPGTPEFSPLVLKTLKRFVTEGVLAQGPSEQSGRAQRALYEVKESEDADEARSAVKEKRRAVYKGR